jgi:N utilization substance protein B
VTLLRAGAFELLYRDKTPSAVVVSEYMKLADKFFPPQKVMLVNAVLDKLAQG